jgi:hypothetical protein
MDNCHCVVDAASQRVLEHLRRVSLAPVDLERIGTQSARLRYLMEALAERAVHECQHASTSAVADRAFHQTGRRRCTDVHRPLRTEHCAQTRLYVSDQFFHFRDAVTDHRLRHRGQHFRPDFRRAGQEEAAKDFLLRPRHLP